MAGSLASIAGIALGAAIGSSRTMRSYVAPSLEFLRPLPASAIIPVAIAMLGLTQSMALFVIAFGAIWPMLLATIHGFAAVEPRLYEVARSLHMSRLAVIFKIALPSASPDILSGMRLSLTVALILSVVCEVLAGLDGLGHWVLLSARAFRSADLFAGVILLGVIGYVTALAMSTGREAAIEMAVERALSPIPPTPMPATIPVRRRLPRGWRATVETTHPRWRRQARAPATPDARCRIARWRGRNRCTGRTCWRW